MHLALVTNKSGRIGSDHLPFEAIDTGRMSNMPQLTYGQGLVDYAMGPRSRNWQRSFLR